MKKGQNMELEFIEDIENYYPVMHSYPSYFELRKLRLPSLAIDIFGIITVLEKDKKVEQIFVYRKYFADILRCSLGSVSRAITILEKQGFIKRTGEFSNILFPIIELTERGKKIMNGVN